MDFHMIEQKLVDESKLNADSHINMQTFNEHFLKNKGVWPNYDKNKKRSSK